jgi:tRNA(Ile)-lysidine synthase
MEMLDEFLKYASPHIHKKWLLAVSGGIDSMVLWDLVRKSNIQHAVAHCNFALRGEDSANDQNFVQATAQTFKTPFFTTSFDTQLYAKQHKLSIQEAARNLRYTWLNQLAEEHNFETICTGHQLNDQLETILFRIAKGTGYKGLNGIPSQNNLTFRPLLFASSSEIEAHAKQENVGFRTDSSNLSNKYSRNLIRNKIVPLLKSINPELEKTFAENIDVWNNSFSFYKTAIENFKKLAVEKDNQVRKLHMEVILNSPAPRILLYEILHPFGFNKTQCDEIIKTYPSKGKIWLSTEYQATLDHTQLWVFTKIAIEPFEIRWNDSETEVELPQGRLTINSQDIGDAEIFVNPNKLKWPLFIRNWKKGDKFFPQGMDGQSKKLKKYFSDEKLNVYQKHTAMVLVDGDKNIIWIIGYRGDHRFMSSENSVKIQFFRNV